MELTRLKELMSVRPSAESLDESVTLVEASSADAFDGIRDFVTDSLADLNDSLGKGGTLAKLFKSSGAAKLDKKRDTDGKTISAQIVAKTAEFKKDIEDLMLEAELIMSQLDESEELDEAKFELSPALVKKGYSHKDVGYYIVEPDGSTSGPHKTMKKAEKEHASAVKMNAVNSKNKIKFGVEGHAGFKKLAEPVAESLMEATASSYDDSAEFTEEFFGMSSDIDKMKAKMKNPRWMAWMKTTDSNYGTDCQTPARAAISAINSLNAQFNDIDTELDAADNA